jgi:hypothetical protein
MFRNQAGPSEFYMVIQLLTLYKVTKKYSKNFFSSTQIIGHKPPENDGFYYFSIGTKRFYHFSSFFIIIRGSSSKTNVILESPSKTTSNQVDSRKNFLRSKTIEKYRKSWFSGGLWIWFVSKRRSFWIFFFSFCRELKVV